MLIIPDGSSKSRALFDQALADRFRITMLVVGDGTGEDVIASKGDVRAHALPTARQVVWVRDPALLTAQERGDFLQGGAVVCVLNLEQQPAVRLTAAQAKSLTQLELAFLRAQQG
ncbi:MAG TPA: hypothetical protein VF541_14765 [Longimicrobium sp.]|jgi:hypothetical protein